MKLDEGNLGDLARGCGIFGAGGGGGPSLGYLMALHAIRELRPNDVVAPAELPHDRRALPPIGVVALDELPDDGLVIPTAMMGAPTVMAEKIANGDEGRRLRDRYEQLLGRPVAAMMCLELGGINGVLPAAWARRAGLPLVDADLMGRAVPQLEMCFPHGHGRARTPGGPCG